MLRKARTAPAHVPDGSKNGTGNGRAFVGGLLGSSVGRTRSGEETGGWYGRQGSTLGVIIGVGVQHRRLASKRSST
jgi:hypothetical protein